MNVTVELSREKETKNTVRYMEAGDEDRQIGMIYIPKCTAAELGNPSRIVLTVSAAA